MKLELFFKACKWAMVAIIIFTICWFGKGFLDFIDSIPKVAASYRGGLP